MNPSETGTIPDAEALRQARERISPELNRTPVLSSRTINTLCGGEVYFKCENMQRVGSFKARGAMNAVLSLSDEDAGRGVVTHSSGNHGAALAFAAARRGISATVAVAALLEGRIDVRNKRIGIILSGGNVDLDHLPWIG